MVGERVPSWPRACVAVCALFLLCSHALSADDMLRFRVTAGASGGRMYDYWRFSGASRAIQAGDCLEYDVYINNNAPGVGGIDIKNTDGSYWRDASGWQDQNGLSGHPGTNIAARAHRKWYHRKLPVPAGVIGKTISSWDVAVDGTYGPDAAVSAQYDNIVITNGGSVVLTAYQNGAPQYATRDFSTGVAAANLLHGPSRKPGAQTAAHFFYWYNAPDLNAHAGYMAYHPYGLKGDPWVGYRGGYYSLLNDAWWEAEFQDLKRAGIDIASLICWGNHPWGFFGMQQLADHMVPALERSGCDIRIALFDDTSSVVCEWNLDNGRGYVASPAMPISDTANWAYFYDRKIKPFFEAIPQKHWATHNGRSLEDGGRPIIITYTAAWFSGVSANGTALWQWVKDRFAADFENANGSGIVPWIIHETSWFAAAGGAAADGRYAWGAALSGPKIHSVSGYYVTEIGPGYDDRPIRTPGQFAERYDGGQLVRWFNSKPSSRNTFDSNLLMVETWNEFWEGTPLQRCKDYPSSSGGYLSETHYMDVWRNLVVGSVGLRDWDATFLRTWQIASKLNRGAVTSVTVRNDGFLPWEPGDCAIGGWLADPRTGEAIPGTARTLASLPQVLLSGDECVASFRVPEDWPEGEVVLQLDMVRDGTWFSAYGDRPVAKALTIDPSSAVLAWEVQTIANGSPIRGLAVDQSNGDIYVMRQDAMVAKYSKDGTLLFNIGPTIKDAGGATRLTLAAGSPTGLAVDPLSRYLYMSIGASIHAVDATADPVVWKWSYNPGLVGGCQNLAISDDGQRLLVAGKFTTNVPNPPTYSDSGAREMARNDAGTPGDPTDDTFAVNGVNYQEWGFLPTLGPGDVRGVTVDRSGRVYVPDLSTNKRPVKRYAAGVNKLEMEFYGVTKQAWGCATDASNNFWLTDIADANNRMVRCYASGMEVFTIDPASDGGHIFYPMTVACDRTNGRVIVAGVNAVTGATTSYLQSWDVNVVVPQAGVISGRVVDGVTSAPVTTVNSISVSSPYYGPTTYGVAFYGVDASGSYSCDVLPGLYSVKATAPGYLAGAVTHYEVGPGSTVTPAAIPLLPVTSDYVTIELGEHNVEQGLFLRSTVPGSMAGYANFAAVRGGRECRGFGIPARGDDERYMSFDVDDAFMLKGSPQREVWMEMDLFDDGPDRCGLQIDTTVDAFAVVGWFFKEGSNTWKTQRFYRPDAYLGNREIGATDLRLGSLWYDKGNGLPAGADYVSHLTLRKSPAESSYEQVNSIADLKQILLGQSFVSPSARYAGGFAVKLTGKTVVATWPDFFYIEESDRSSGIRVMGQDCPIVGSVVDITGYVMAVPENQEMCLAATSVDFVGFADSVPQPLGLRNRFVAGGPVRVSRTLDGKVYTLAAQPGVYQGIGVSNVGLLATVWGRVTAVGSDLAGNGFFYLDDGSPVRGEGGHEGDHIGVKVVGEGLSVSVDQYVAATGMVSLGLYDPTPENTLNGDAYYYPVVLLIDYTVLQ